MNERGEHSVLSGIMVGLLSFILAFPLFILAHRELPDLNWPFHLDRILIFIILSLLLILFLRLFRPIIMIGFIVVIMWLGYGSLMGRYGFKDVYKDYRALLYRMNNDPHQAKITFVNTSTNTRQKQILAAIDYENPVVRDFAVSAANEFFRNAQQKNDEYRTAIQCFSVFKKINSHWNYVNDPESREYFAKASESVNLLAGDCDDYSILMAACIKAIGGKPRLVITTGHIYPELYIGNKNDLERINFLIKKQLFPNESRYENLYYHRSADGSIWLNMDYNSPYPGGLYLAEPLLEVFYP